MNTRPLYIFDLDGTLALIEHRRHFVESPTKNWPAFFAACVDDAPNLPVVRTLLALKRSGADILIWSGRSDEVRQETEQWLRDHSIYEMTGRLIMRKAGDHQNDETLKLSWLQAMPADDRNRLIAIFDDRDRVVNMWRTNGVACFQVAAGNF
jgi:hypothetical protein